MVSFIFFGLVGLGAWLCGESWDTLWQLVVALGTGASLLCGMRWCFEKDKEVSLGGKE